MIKISSVILLLLISVNIYSANSIQNETCNVYLPINQQLTGWGELKQKFIKKGYFPIELEGSTLNKEIEPGSLYAELNYNWAAKPLGWKRCIFSLEVKKLIRKFPQDNTEFLKLESATVYSDKSKNYSFMTIRCGLSEWSAFNGLPKCKQSR